MKPVAFRKSHILLGLEDSINTNGIIQHSAKSLQSCPTLCDPIDGSPQGSPVPGILQARTLERVVISFSNAWKWKVKVKSLSNVQLFATPWTAAHQAPPPMGFSRQEYCSGVPEELLLYTHTIPGLGRSPGGGHGNPLQYSFFSLSFKN